MVHLSTIRLSAAVGGSITLTWSEFGVCPLPELDKIVVLPLDLQFSSMPSGPTTIEQDTNDRIVVRCGPVRKLLIRPETYQVRFVNELLRVFLFPIISSTCRMP